MNFSGKKIHFIGIGGIGISGLARYFQHLGAKISGSDIAENAIIASLRGSGVSINVPHDARAVEQADLVINSAIICEQNPEILAARQKNIKILSRSDAISVIFAKKRVLSVCGAHGKSSTSAMLSAILPEFSAIIGAETKEFGANIRMKSPQNIVFEADESDRSFLRSNPHTAIITNAEPEHMESYDFDEKKLQDAYKNFAKMAKNAVLNLSDDFLKELFTAAPKTLQITALDPKNDIKNTRFFLKNDEPFCEFVLQDLGKFCVHGIGEHTAQNAAMAILTAKNFTPIEQIRKNLKNFAGIKKRFDILQTREPIIIDDYAHHPTEIIATLKSARIYANLRGVAHVTAIWQPHKFSRLLANLPAFAESFFDCDRLVILPVFGAYERQILNPDLNLPEIFKKFSPIFADRIVNDGGEIVVLSDGSEILRVKSGLVIGLGAGDITDQLRGKK